MSSGTQQLVLSSLCLETMYAAPVIEDRPDMQIIHEPL